MCAELYVFKTAFEPVCLPGEVIRVVTENEKFDAECVAVGALPEHVKDFGALVAGTWDTENKDTDLEMQENEISQLRMRVLTPMEVRFNNLGSSRQWRTAKTSFTLGQWPDNETDFLKDFLFKASEFFIYKDDTPSFDLYSDLAQVASRIVFSGWRYRISKKSMGTVRPAKTIWVSGWPSGNIA
jgi:hypothetical protein